MAQKKPKIRKFSFFTRIALSFNILVILGLLLSYLSLYVSPEKNWLLPFFGLLYPYLLLLNLLFVFYWLIRTRWFLILSLLVVFSGWNVLARTIQLNLSLPPVPTGNTFRVMSYNVRNMSNNNLLVQDLEVRDAIVDQIRLRSPDILCLQEFEAAGSDPAAFIDSLATALQLPHYTYTRYYEKISRRIDAIITFSRFPIMESISVKKDDMHNYSLVTDLLIGEDTVRLVNIHLESVRFRHEDYTFINDLDLQFGEQEDLKEGSRRIFNKLRLAYVKRSAQVRNLKELIRHSPHPVILCGDFNDTPCSFSYQALAEGKQDAFMESGSGLGNTYAGTLPSLRIDYILYDPVFRSYDYATGREELSDHYLVTAQIGWRN